MVARSTYLYRIVGIAEILAATIITTLVIWINEIGGLEWIKTFSKIILYHMLMMPLSFILLGNGAIVYRLLANSNVCNAKFIHWLLQTLSLIGFLFGFYCSTLGRENFLEDVKHFNSLHSWMGLTFLVMFLLQYLCGLVFFVCRIFNRNTRSCYAALHAYIGLILFILAGLTILLGVTQKVEWLISYLHLVGHNNRIFANTLGITVLLFMGTIIFIVINVHFEWDKLPTGEYNCAH